MLRTTAMVLALAWLAPLHAAASTAIIEYYNASLDHYFITWVPDEIAKLDAGTVIKGWTRTGKTFRTYSDAQGGASPVCRYYIPPGLGDSHFFGRGEDECVATGQKNPSFVLESSTFMYMFLPSGGTCPAGTTDVYRVFSNRPDANHRYMTDKSVRDEMVAKGWLAEGDGPDLVVMCAPADTGPVSDFAPSASTALNGALNYASVTIPAGVTVTLTGDTFVSATGAVNIAGNIVGDCKALSITTTGALNVTGNIDNHCATLPAGEAPDLTLFAKGGYHFTGAGVVTTSGALTVTNNLARSSTALIDADGLVVPTLAEPTPRLAKAGPYACESIGRPWLLNPVQARDGNDGGKNGQDGKSAKPSVFWCDEGANGFIDRTTIFARDGGNGGSGSDLLNPNGANATGGNGGNGANLIVYVTGDLDFGTNNVLNGGDGGSGGSARATSAQNATPPVAPPATATSGKGGDAGLITIQVGGAIAISGPLTLNVGRGGDSGNATAMAADGVDSNAGRDAQVGGTAGALSKDAGKLPRGQLKAGGNVVGLANVTVTGGPGGTSGFADATGGKGGDGTLPTPGSRKDGAAGGGVTAVSGHGGSVETRDVAGALVGNGGNSGDALFKRGLGGKGFDDCTAPLTAGGKGGNGGPVLGGAGSAGLGRANGTAGTTREIVLSNGGNGGHGLGPGLGGSPGAATIVPAGPVILTPPVFTPGAKGRGCRFQVTLTVASDPNPPHEGFVGYTTITILDALVDNAAGTIAISGVAGGKWIACTGPYNKATGDFTCNGSGTAAGYANVPETFTGSINLANGTISGLVTLGGGAAGPLPGHSVSYNVTGTVTGVTPP